MSPLKPVNEKILKVFERFENLVTVVLSLIIASIIIISVIRILQNFYTLFIYDVTEPEQITFKDYQELFGKILTLLISLEFMSSILKVLRSHEIKTLVLDVILITALAIARKLIVFDYDHHDPLTTFSLAGLILAIGVFYFLIKQASFRSKSDQTKA